MSVPPDYLRYPLRKVGLDHNWFHYEPTRARKPLVLPNGARIALWIVVPVEFFPLDAPTQPFRPVGALDRAYPDFWTYSNRDYGNRIGVFRIARVLDRLGLTATAAVNADIAKRYPFILDELLKRNWEIMAHGVNMGCLHHGGLARDAEAALIDEAVTVLRRATGQEIRGWQSPANSQSLNTFELLAEAGIRYVGDWINDDLPYEVSTPKGSLCSLPLTHEWSDRNILVQHDLTIEDYEQQVIGAFRCLEREAQEHGPRILSLSVTPWILGYPHRIRGLERVLTTILNAGSVWLATGTALLEAFYREP
jgi:peptidoglycan/xylan/chitin deacetylase (PgdA/CDA1 family)